MPALGLGLDKAVIAAAAGCTLALSCTIVTFSPHPLAVLAPEAAPWPLMSIDDRVSHTLSLGIDTVVVLPFTMELAAQPAVDFPKADGLVTRLDMRLLIVGDNFGCGRGDEGDVLRIADLGGFHGYS